MVLNAGEAHGEALVLEEPLSFWGGYDPETGTVIDRYHPQAGICLANTILVMPATRGSSGTPGILAESLCVHTGPAALILGRTDVNVTAAGIVVAELYGLEVPIVVLDEMSYAVLRTGDHVEVRTGGEVILHT